MCVQLEVELQSEPLVSSGISSPGSESGDKESVYRLLQKQKNRVLKECGVSSLCSGCGVRTCAGGTGEALSSFWLPQAQLHLSAVTGWAVFFSPKKPTCSSLQRNVKLEI